jgi:hypothetical protein
VFINPALTEPFGLTLLEAAASGLPLVATENGGPVDIIANCDNGILVDPLDAEAIAAALLRLLTDRGAWRQASRNGLEGVRRFYTWQAHAGSYLEKVRALMDSPRKAPEEWPDAPKSSPYRDRAIFTDIDQTPAGRCRGPAALRRHHRRATQAHHLRHRHRPPRRLRAGGAEKARRAGSGRPDQQPRHPHSLRLCADRGQPLGRPHRPRLEPRADAAGAGRTAGPRIAATSRSSAGSRFPIFTTPRRRRRWTRSSSCCTSGNSTPT